MKARHVKQSVTVAREMTIVNELGLHARPAAEFVRRASGFRSEIWLVKDGKRFSATSLIDVMRANVDWGTTETLEATGVDAEAALERLAQVVREFKDEN